MSDDTTLSELRRRFDARGREIKQLEEKVRRQAGAYADLARRYKAAQAEVERLREAIELLDATEMNQKLEAAGVPIGPEGIATLTARAEAAEAEPKGEAHGD